MGPSMTRYAAIVGILIAFGIGAAFLSIYNDNPNGVASADPADAKAVGLGRQIYADFFASCHGDNLHGQPD